MTPTETAAILRQFNAWQKGDGPLDYSMNGLITAVDTAIEMIDRLEAAERNLSCCRAEREEAASLFLSTKTRLTDERDALRARIEVAEKELDALRSKNNQYEMRLRKILEEPENTISNSKALAEAIRQARLALGVKK